MKLLHYSAKRKGLGIVISDMYCHKKKGRRQSENLMDVSCLEIFEDRLDLVEN